MPDPDNALFREDARNRPIRVALVTHYFSTHRGGVEKVAGELATRLARTGRYAITWLSSDASATPSSLAGLEIVPINAWNGLERIAFPWPIWGFGSIGILRRAIRSSDVVHVHDFIYFGSVVAYFIARHAGKPIVVTQHIGDIPFRNPLLRVLIRVINRTLGRMVLGGADRVLFISDAVRRHFGQYIHFRRVPCHVPNGVDTSVFHPVSSARREEIRRELGIEPHTHVLLYVGRFVDKKGLPLLRTLAAQMPGHRWWFAGWGQPDAPAHPASWNLSNVRVFGDRSGATLALLYCAADLLVLASLSEGFPLVVQEAMACGTQSLVAERIADGAPDVGALLLTCPIDPTDEAVAKWKSAIGSALAALDGATGPSRREALVEFAKSHWAWEGTVARYEEILAAVINSRR